MRQGEDLGASRINHLQTSSRAGFEPHRACDNIHGDLALVEALEETVERASLARPW
jgi:hypothetical protein